MNDLVVADKLNPALIETPEQGAKFVKVFRAAVEAARTVGADRTVTNKYAEKMVRSVRATGALIAELPRSPGKRTDKEPAETHFRRFVSDAAIDERTARNWQFVAAIPQEEFEQRIAELRDAPDPNILITLSPFYGTHNHRAQGSGENEWYTPKEYIEIARKALAQIDLDPASSEIAQRTVKAKRYFTKEQDGLTKKWERRVWLNPPYSQPAVQQFIEKLVSEVQAKNVTEAVLLTHNYTDTEWFHIAASACALICFTRGRIKFVNAEGEMCAPTQGQAFFYYGKRPQSFKRAFEKIGFIR